MLFGFVRGYRRRFVFQLRWKKQEGKQEDGRNPLLAQSVTVAACLPAGCGELPGSWSCQVKGKT